MCGDVIAKKPYLHERDAVSRYVHKRLLYLHPSFTAGREDILYSSILRNDSDFKTVSTGVIRFSNPDNDAQLP